MNGIPGRASSTFTVNNFSCSLSNPTCVVKMVIVTDSKMISINMMFASCDDDDDIFDDGVDLLCSQLLDLLGGLCEQALEVGGEGAHLVNQEDD